MFAPPILRINMLDLLNRYAHGYVAVPVIVSLRRRRVFDRLQDSSLTCAQLAQELTANAGHLAVAIRLLESLGWCDVDDAGGIQLADASQSSCLIPADLVSLYDQPIGISWLQHCEADRLKELSARSAQCWGIPDGRLADMVDGAFVVPLLLSLKATGKHEAAMWDALPRPWQDEIESWFATKRWAVVDDGQFELTDVGRTILDRIPITGTVASYRPMLARMDDLLFGDADSLFQRDESGHETHLDRTLNVASSGFQHDRYFADLEEIVVAIFNRPPLDDQPRYVADMGCGDGTLLKKIYEKIRDETERGKVLDSFPITLIGIDYNQKSLEATANTLAGLPHLALPGDIADPRQLLTDLRRHGISDPENILHVRSFLDHDRPFRMPEDSAAARQRGVLPPQGVYTHRNGKAIAATDVAQSLVEHLRRWATIVTRFGLIVLEVHSLPPRVVREFLDESENLHYDAFHGFSGQLLVEPDQFLMAMAEAGLFPESQFLRRYPQLMPFTRITLNRFQPRPYLIRHARIEDLESLIRLESECWDEVMRASDERISQRIARCPEGQFVLETGEGVVGVLYTQRIADPKLLDAARDDNVEALFDRSGSFAQLITVNVSPSQQQRGLGDQLLEFVLQVLSMRGGIERAVGVTRCRDYAEHSMPLEEYVRLRGEDGTPVDPILRFHDAHGAAIVKLLPGYRPADRDNDGCGVLIEYDLRRRKSKHAAAGTQFGDGEATTTVGEAIESVVASTIKEILREDADDYSATATLLDLGLDSMGMLELRTMLSRHFQQELESTFLFEYDTAEAIIDYFSR